MTFQNDSHDGVEAYRIEDIDGDLYAVITYFDRPRAPFSGWVVDYRDGQRLTGDVADEAARHLLNNPGTSGSMAQRFDQQADSILDTVAYDDDSGMACITWHGVDVWFGDAVDHGDDIVLYESDRREARAGVLTRPPFHAGELRDAVAADRRRLGVER